MGLKRMPEGEPVKTRKQMRNIFIRRMDDILIRYYKAIDFDLLVSEENRQIRSLEETYRREVMELIALMRELELLSAGEYTLLREVYGEYFGLASC